MITFVTAVSYGAWLPGDLRGYWEREELLPGLARIQKSSAERMKGEMVVFSKGEQSMLVEAMLDGCKEFGYRLTDVSVEAWHLHWIVEHTDASDAMIGRLKTRMRQALGRGRIWAEGYWRRVLKSQDAVGAARRYVGKHGGCRVLNGVRVKA